MNITEMKYNESLLRREITGLRADGNALRDERDNLKARVATLEGEVATSKQDFRDLNVNAVDYLNQRIEARDRISKLESELRYERFGSPAMQSDVPGADPEDPDHAEELYRMQAIIEELETGATERVSKLMSDFQDIHAVLDDAGVEPLRPSMATALDRVRTLVSRERGMS